MIQLLEGDCSSLLTSLIDSSIGLIYTDPPYEMSYVSSIPGDPRWNSTGESTSRFNRALTNDIPGALQWERIWSECYRVLKQDSYLVTHGNFPFLSRQLPLLEAAGFSYKGLIAWNKRSAIGGDIKGSLKRDWEPLLYMSKGKPSVNPIEVLRDGEMQLRSRISEISDWAYSIMKEARWGHPTQKPLDLAIQVLKLFSGPADKILDPFAGSGTSLIAARQLNRAAVGIEVDREYIELIRRRLE